MSGAARPAGTKPRNVAIAGTDLAIAWADGHESYLPLGRLRSECPCATCRARTESDRSAGPLRVLAPEPARSASVARVVPVGAYAIQIVWADGHDAGIYTYDLLRAACPCEECADR
jgi:DUF971 family protein